MIKGMGQLVKAYKKIKEEESIFDMLKKEPLQSTYYKRMILNSGSSDEDKSHLLSIENDLKKDGYVIDDIPEPYEDFAARVEQEGSIPIKKSVLKQMSTDELKQIMSKKMGIYPDIKGEHITHYRYRDKKGYTQKTGEGQGVRHVDSNDINTIKQANKIYREAKDEIQKTLTEIEVNGDKYQDFMIEK